jgi:hypothetical protein
MSLTPSRTPTTPPPPSWPAGQPLAPAQSERRWPRLLAAAGAGAVIASLTAALVTIGARDDAAVTTSTTTTVVAPITASTVAVPAPLQLAEADRQICQKGWIEAVRLIDAAGTASAPLRGLSIDAPSVKSSPDLVAVVNRVGELISQSAGALKARANSGATPILSAAAATTIHTLEGAAAAYFSFDAVGAATFERVTNAAAAEMTALCRRLAPL